MKVMRCLLGAILISVLWVAGGLHPTVAAEGEAAISIQPASSYFYLDGNHSATLQVYVENMVDLNAYELIITYDPALVELTAWAHGGILINLREFIYENSPGFLHLVYLQIATPGFNGSGVLLNLTFNGIAAGISAVTLAKVDLANGLGQTIPTQIQHGTIAIGDYFPVYGNISLEGQSSRGGIPVTLTGGPIFGAGPYAGQTVNQAGVNLIINNVLADTYTVTTAQPRCLNVTAELNKTITMTGAYTMQPLTLHCGNALWSDNIINDSDVGIIGGQWNMTPDELKAGETLNGDVNFDNIVNIRDWALVAGNYGLSSEDVYAGWTP